MRHNLKVSLPLAIIITLIAVIYQRSTGPTYPKKFKIGTNRDITVKFLRSQGGTVNAPVEVPAIEGIKDVELSYKRYPTHDDWTTLNLEKSGNLFKGELPAQPAAGKITYFLKINYGDSVQELGSKDDPIYIRYKGEVPTYILAPHIVSMFMSMLLSVVALFEAIFRTKLYKKVGRITLGFLMFGGMFLGPIVQKYAFDVYWAGFPFDWDLTDNKLLIGVLVWLFAVVMSLKSERRWPTILAACTLFVVYSIPHSMQGSEYDYEQNKIITDRD